MKVVLTGFIKSYFDENKCVGSYGIVLQVTKNLVGNTLNALSSMVAVSDETEMPVWLGEEQQGPFLAVRDGLLDISGLPHKAVCIQDNSPLWFSTVAFPINYDRNAKCERWLQFLDEVMEGDQERIDLLQEWTGYVLTNDTTQHKFVFAEGEGANGKSVWLDVVTALLGPENVAHVPLEMFGTRFQLTVTLQKLANICAEVGEIDKVAEGFLKQFTAGDRMYFDRKNITGVMAYPTARLMLSSNNRPRFRDRSDGLWRRMIVIPFQVTIPTERQDPFLTGKLKEELPGIFVWALAGLKRLRRNKRFTVPAICQTTLEDYRRERNPAMVFLRENCREESTATTNCGRLYDDYAEWSHENRFEVLNASQFGKEMRKAFRHVERVRISGGAGLPRQWVYRGVSYVLGSPNEALPQTVEHVSVNE
jgi:putative DNA primase/helicase